MGFYRLNKNKINQAIKSLKDKPITLSDGNCLQLYLSSANKGEGRWYLTVRDGDNKQLRINLGAFDIKAIDKEEEGFLTLDGAREVAEKLRDTYSGKRKQKKQEQVAEQLDHGKTTLNEAFNRYMELRASKLRPRTAENYYKITKRLLDVGLLYYPLEDITNDLLGKNLAHLYAQNKHSTIKVLFEFINMMKKFAAEIELTGALRLNRANLVFDLKETQMRNFLEPVELPDFFEKLKTAELSSKELTLLLTLILTMCRYNEVYGFEAGELIDDPAYGKVWDIPPERMKGKRRHIIRYEGNDLLEQVLTKLSKHQPDFKSSDQSKIARVIKTITQRNITLHGFRSTASTLLNALYPQRINEISLCLAHKLKQASEVDERYNRHVYVKEKGEVYQLWCDYLKENTCIEELLQRI